jgi:tetratricopeptide (TPR) repeat protein
MMDWSHELLSQAERRLFRRLAVFAGGWTLEAAEAVCADEALDTWAVVEHLAGLVNKSLAGLETGAGGEPGRYRMLETVRQYASEKLAEAGEEETTRARHLQYYLKLSDEAEPHLFRAEQLAWLARLQAEQDNLRAALAWAIERQASSAVSLAANLHRFFRSGLWLEEGCDWLRRSLEASAGDPPSRDHARAMLSFGNLSVGLGRPRGQWLEGALALSRALGDDHTTARTLWAQANFEHREGNLAHAEALAEECLEIFKHLRDVWGQGIAEVVLAEFAFARGDIARAVTLAQRSLAHAEESGDRILLERVLSSFFMLARTRGDYERAAQLGQKRVAIARELGEQTLLSEALADLGELAYRQADYAQANALLKEGLAAALDVRHSPNEILCLGWLGVIASVQGDCERAEQHHAQALSLAKALGKQFDWRLAQRRWGLSAYSCGDAAESADRLAEALRLEREGERRQTMALTCWALARARLALGNEAQAEELLREGLEIGEAVGDGSTLALLQHLQGRLEMRGGDLDHAWILFRESLVLWVKLGAKGGVAESLEGLGALAARQSDGERAARLLGAAEALREAIGAPVPPPERMDYEEAVRRARELLGAEVFEACWREGRGMKWEEAAEVGLEG